MAQEVAVPLEATEVRTTPRKPLWQRLVRTARHHPLGTVGVAIVIVLICCALFAELIAPYDPQAIDPHALRNAPSFSHPFGTDRLGRDVMSRTIYGARISMFIGMVSVIIGTLLGAFFGLISGYFAGKDVDMPWWLQLLLSPLLLAALGLVSLVVLLFVPLALVLRSSRELLRSGWTMFNGLRKLSTIDSLIQRVIDMLLAFPALVLLLAIIAVLTNEDSAFRQFLSDPRVLGIPVFPPVPDGTFLGIPVFIQIFVMSVGIGVAIAVGTARVVRGAVLSLKENVYIDAARAMGASDGRIIFRHILPNVMALVVVLATIFLPIAILAEAAISFLGLGVPNPTPSWGSDMTGPNQKDAVTGNIWWVVFFPGAALSLTVLAFNMIGDSLRDISDPRLRGGRGGGSGPGTGTGF